MTRVNPRTLKTSCCIAGGGPAGMTLGFLLARMGVDVIVLEKHKDFLRDFRGDTIHPSTLDIIQELGFLKEFLKRPHQEVRELVRPGRRRDRHHCGFQARADALQVSGARCRNGTFSTS